MEVERMGLSAEIFGLVFQTPGNLTYSEAQASWWTGQSPGLDPAIMSLSESSKDHQDTIHLSEEKNMAYALARGPWNIYL